MIKYNEIVSPLCYNNCINKENLIMSFLKGGDTDKRGNYYENKFITYKYAELLCGEIKSIQQETYHQDEEKGVDVIVTSTNGQKIYYQCKARNGIKDYWDVDDLENVIKKAILHTNVCKFYLVSPLSSNHVLKDLCERSRKFSELKDFEENGLGGQKQKTIYNKVVKFLPQSSTEEILNFFHNFDFFFLPDDRVYIQNYLNTKAYIQDIDMAYDILCSYIESNSKLQTPLFFDEIYNYLKRMGVSSFALNRENDCQMLKEIQANFIESLNRRRINNRDYTRKESDELYNSIFNNKFTILNGESGCGKSIITKQVCDKLIQGNITFLPIDLSIYSLNTNYVNFCKDLGLSGTISMSINQIKAPGKSFVIIDQIDSIQWGSPSDHQAKDLCSELIKETLNYNDINVLFVTRSINTEEVKKLIDYETKKTIRNIETINVYSIGKLEEKVIKTIIPEFDNLSIQLKSLLMFPNNIKYYIDIKSSSKNNIATINELIKTYLNERFILLKDEEDSAKDIITQIVNLLKNNNASSIHKNSLHKFSDNLICKLKSNGIIVENNEMIKFAHQSLYDFYIAEKLYEDYERGINVNKILLEYANKPIENYNKIKQFLEMLYRDYTKFCHNLDLILFDIRIPFIFKKLAFNYFSLLNESYYGYTDLYIKLKNSKVYGKRYLYNLTAGKNILFKVLVEDKFIDSLINSNIKEDNVLALNILLSLQDSVDICPYLNRFITLHNTKEFLASIIHNIDDLKSCDLLFDIKINLLSKNKFDHFYVNWKNIIKNNTDRTYKYLKTFFSSDKYTENTIDLNYKELKNEIDLLISQYKEKLFEIVKSYIKTSVSRFKIISYDHKGIRAYNNEDVALFLYSLIVPVLKVDCIWNEINDMELKDIAFVNLNRVPKTIGYKLLKKIVKNNYIKKQNFQYHPPFIFKLKNFIKNFIEGLNPDEVNKLVEQIIDYRNPNLLSFAKERFEQKKMGFYHHFFEEEQKVLLNGIPEENLPIKYKKYIAFLNRKFKTPEIFSENYVYGVRSYNVVSGINKGNKLWSKKAFVKLLKSKKAGLYNSRKKEKLDEKGNLISCDKYHINQFIYDSAYKYRPLFVEIILNEENLRSDFVFTIFSALSNKFSNKELQEDCSATELLKAYKKYYNKNKDKLIGALIDFAQHYNCFDDWLINNLLSVAKGEDKEISLCETDVSSEFSSEWNNHFSNKQSGSIVALSKYLWECDKEPNWFNDIFDLCLSSGKLHMAIAGIDLLIPLYNIDKEKTCRLLIQILYRYPNVLEGSECWRMIDYLINEHYKDFYKLFKCNSLNFNDKTLKNITNRFLCYYVYYGYFKRELTKKIKTSNNYNLAYTCGDLLKNISKNDYKIKIKKIVKSITKYNQLETANLLYSLDENFVFFAENDLIKPIILKGKDKYDRELYIHHINTLLTKMPSLLKYKNIIFLTIKKYLKNKNNSKYYISYILNWLLRIYGEAYDKTTRKQCLKVINNIYKDHLFNTSIIDIDV